MTETLTVSEILKIEWTSVRASHSTVLAQNFGTHTKSRSSPSSGRQKNKQKKNLKKPQKPPPNKQTRKPLLSGVFQTKATSHSAQFCQRHMSAIDMSSNMTQTNPFPKINKSNHIDEMILWHPKDSTLLTCGAFLIYQGLIHYLVISLK